MTVTSTGTPKYFWAINRKQEKIIVLHVRRGFYYISLTYFAQKQRDKIQNKQTNEKKKNKNTNKNMTLWQQSEPTTPNLLIARILSLYFVHFAQYKREGTYREILKGSVDFQFQDTFSMLLPLCLL